MVPYLIVLLTAASLTYFGRVSGSLAIQRASLVLVGILLICFCGFRDYHVGTDTGNYVRTFNNIHYLKDIKRADMEIGYLFLSWLAKLVSSDYIVLLTAIAAIGVVLYLSTIVRLIEKYEFGVYLFIVFGSYTWFFNGARQAIAGGICFWGIRYLIDRKITSYAICILIAMLFHKTAVIAFLPYFLASSKLTKKRLIGIIVSILVFAIFVRVFVGFATQFLDDKYANYAAQTGGSGGHVITAYITVQAGIFYFFRNRVTKNRELYTRLVNIYLLALIPAYLTVLSGVNPSGIMRLANYFSSTEILVWPILFQEIRKARQRDLVGFAFLLGTLMYFYLTTVAFGDLVPYQFNNRLF